MKVVTKILLFDIIVLFQIVLLKTNGTKKIGVLFFITISNYFFIFFKKLLLVTISL